MRWVPLAGLVAPILLVGFVLLQTALYPDYDAVELPVSALATWPLGALMNLSFVASGLLFAAFSLQFGARLPQRLESRVADWLLVVSGAGLVLLGLFPWRVYGGDFVQPGGHLIGGLAAFFGAGAGFVILSRALASEPHWERLSGFLRWSGWLIVVLFAGYISLAARDGMPFHPWAGLWERGVIGIWLAAVLGISLRWLRLSGWQR